MRRVRARICAMIILVFNVGVVFATATHINIMTTAISTIAVINILKNYRYFTENFIDLLKYKANKLPVNGTCTGSYMCDDNIGLQCWSGICNCNSSQYYDYSYYNNCSK
jgi:hypothetical protein